MRKKYVEQWISDNKLDHILYCSHAELNRWVVIFRSIFVVLCTGKNDSNGDIWPGFHDSNGNIWPGFHLQLSSIDSVSKQQQNNSLKNIILTALDYHTKNKSLKQYKLKLSMLKTIINNIEEE